MEKKRGRDKIKEKKTGSRIDRVRGETEVGRETYDKRRKKVRE